MYLQLVDQFSVLFMQLHCEFVLDLDELMGGKHAALIEEDVGIGGVRHFGPPILRLEASEALPFNVLLIEGSDVLVIELQPAVLLGLDERVIVPAIGCSSVDDDSLERILSVDGGVVVLDVVLEVEHLREGELGVDLDLVTLVGIVDDPLQVEHDYLRQFVEVSPLADLADLLVALLAEVVSHLLLLRELLETVLEVVVVLHLDHQAVVLLVLLDPVAALLTGNLC